MKAKLFSCLTNLLILLKIKRRKKKRKRKKTLPIF